MKELINLLKNNNLWDKYKDKIYIPLSNFDIETPITPISISAPTPTPISTPIPKHVQKLRVYGFPYMGSKSSIAYEIISRLPSGDRFVDLFGGGGAMSHCASLSGKYKTIVYNDINPLTVQLMKRIMSGEFSDPNWKPEFVSRDEFHAKKDTDAYIRYIWSFGNKGTSYLYGEEIEQYKQMAHYFIVFEDEEAERWLMDYFKDTLFWLIHFVDGDNYQERRNNYRDVVTKIIGIKESGRLDEFKNITYNELRNMRQIDICGEKIGYTQGQITSLERIQHLESLGRLRINSNIEINNKDYREIEIKDGDVVYCDIPYENQTQYEGIEDFDILEFYNWAYSRDFGVYFSSYDISDDRFQVIWSKDKRVTLKSTANNLVKTEKLYWNGK